MNSLLFHSSVRRWLLAAGLLVLLAAAASPAGAVVLDDENRITVVLDDGTQVVLYGEATSSPGGRSNKYYYLPVNLRLGKRPDGTPEFLFMKFVTEEAGKPSGAIMHFLMEWGLTPEQESELKAKLKTQHSNAELVGAVPLQTEGETGSYQIVSATLSGTEMAPVVVTSGKAPLLPGGKAAAAARLTAEGAQLLAATFERARSITDLSIALNFAYVTLAPAARGYIQADWSKLEREHESLRAEYARTHTGTEEKGGCWFIFCSSSYEPTYSYSYDEARSQYKFLEEKQIVTVHFDEMIPDERVAKIRDAFFQYFLNTMTEPAGQQGALPPPSDKEKEKAPDIRFGNSYKFSQTSFKSSFARKVQRFDLNYRTAVRWPVQLVGNLASWYDGVRDNPRAVAAVNLNDPFYQHRNIYFILDLDTKDIFDEEINYADINVRKTRSGGERSWADGRPMDAKYVRENGITLKFEYARGTDTNPDVYEYKVQWSVRGGQILPSNPAWQRGDWAGVTLSAPLIPRTIEVEGDLDALKASDITRVTVQIHHTKFGEEVEEQIQFSPAKGEPLVAQRIFTDRGAKGYVYRLVINHKTEGKLALPWSAKVSDDYIYITIPPELLADAGLKETAKEAAKTVREKVLDKFKDVLGGNPQ